jgi:hypothetical protein
VALKQGSVFPYSFGMWLISQLVGALNPHDLDAMDDCRPLSCFSMETVFGRRLSPEEYQLYWRKHPLATRLYNSYWDTMLRNPVFGNVVLPVPQEH